MPFGCLGIMVPKNKDALAAYLKCNFYSFYVTKYLKTFFQYFYSVSLSIVICCHESDIII